MTRFWRWYDYYIHGYGTYVSRPVTLASFLLIIRLYLAEYAPEIIALSPLLQNFLLFFMVSGGVVLALSVLFGWFHIKRKPFKLWRLLEALEDPLVVLNNYLILDSLISLLSSHNLDIPTEVRRARDLYRDRFEKMAIKVIDVE